MSILRYFKSRRPTPAPVAPSISREDVLVALHWGYTPAQWCALDNHVRTAKRSDYFQAAGLGA